ncbi:MULTISPECIES: tautomerase family protein [Brevibacillus]|jgi:4-oxalocrotonate tautomerase|uniref:Tautomerase n=1 Tax=Brevibacillus aydinogluensis TaxID=927786 RepID=A0AA48MAR2_9BACL|nr:MULTISPECIES: 2-hydroxymuconate tautomerase family protein [Bacillales]REK63025.1 MAG: 4-oxalocrotonate tautomerase [Brevibacillus sp.]MBR8658279.1 2-hydroxymuconate tautomerase family protein [Brevibacillus sp. NL20B1]MDT3414687.1 4-oxalocrotonate tautomerase [Brevibacillus aydinogluensis]UFJ61044.1 2-hydroxymuconate tautomerase family protein [Anoxybacillus sediminis]CAJ1002139.1 Tautomerase [Brevibacillus aydinogluensis]
MPILEIKLLEGRDQEVKERLIADVTKTVSETLQVAPERVRIILYEIPLNHWAIGGKTVKENQAEKERLT